MMKGKKSRDQITMPQEKQKKQKKKKTRPGASHAVMNLGMKNTSYSPQNLELDM